MRIHWILAALCLAEPSAFGQFNFEIDLEQAGPTSLAIYRDGVLVRTLFDAAQREAGRQHVTWDLLDDDGHPVHAGSFTFRTLNGSAVGARYIATVANGRHPQVEGDLGGVEGMALFDVVVDDDGTIYTDGIGHGRSVQKISPDGKQRLAATNISAVEVPSAIALDGKYVFVVGDEGFYRLDKHSMKAVRFDGDLVIRFANPPTWFPPGTVEQQRDAQQRDALACVAHDGGNDPRVHAWRGITRHPLMRFEGDRIRGAVVWGDRLLVGDSHDDTVRLYDVQTGKFIETWPGIVDPAGMVVRGDELLVVSQQQVIALDRTGSRKGVVIERGLVRPMGLALGPAPEHLIHVTELGIPNQVKIFSAQGRLLRRFGRAGPFNGRVAFDKLGIPRGIAVDGDGNIIFTEFAYNRIQKLSPQFEPLWDLQAFYCYLAVNDQTDPQWIYGFEGPMLPVIKQFHIDYDTGRWELTRAWYFHKFDDAGSYYGYPSTGGGALTIDGHKFVYVHHKTMRIYRLDGDDLVPVVRIGPRISFRRGDGTRVDYHRGQAPTHAIWHDENHDRQIDEVEVSILDDKVAAKRAYLWRSNDANIAADGTVYMGNLAFACRGVIDGIPRYDWDHVTATQTSTPGKEVTIHGTTGVGVDEKGNRYYGIRESAAGAGAFKGMTYWAKRAGWQHVVKHAPDGRRLWRAGRKAYGVVQPGEFSYHSSLDWASGFVFVGDWDGYVHVFSDDGLFVTRLFKGTREGADQDSDPDCITSYELGHIRAFMHPQTRRTFVMGQSLEGGEYMRVYEINGLDTVARTEGSIEVAAADLDGVMANPRQAPSTTARGPIPTREIAVTSVLEPPVMDGTLDTWTRLVSPETIGDRDDPGQVAVLLRYDEKYLYLGARCENDISPARNAHYPEELEQLWRGDCLNLFINTDPSADRARRKYAGGDLHLYFPLSHRHAGKPLEVYSRTAGSFVKESEFRVQVPGPQTWTMTARIPWRSLGGYQPKPGDLLHLNIQVDFSDPTGRSPLFSLNLGGKDRSYAVPNQWNAEGRIMYAR